MLAKRRKRREKPNRKRNSPTTTPLLRFTPTAWAKLLFWRDLGTTEIGGFGISADQDPLLIEDVRLIRQVCSAVTVKFDDGAVADFFDEQVDHGLPPERFSRVWIHTHPAQSCQPSAVDETTFARVFGAFHWSVMFILARGGASYARLQYRIGPGGAWEIPVGIEYGEPFPATDHSAWRRDYDDLVEAEPEWNFDDGFYARQPPDDWPFDIHHWEETYDGAVGLRSLRSAERLGADGPLTEHLGDGDRRRLDRPPGSAATDGVGSAEIAVD